MLNMKGILEAAPWVFSVLEEEGIGIIEEIGLQFTDIVENISFMQRNENKCAVEKQRYYKHSPYLGYSQ